MVELVLRVVRGGLSHAGAVDHPGVLGEDYSPRAFAMISVATLVGTWAYESNCME